MNYEMPTIPPTVAQRVWRYASNQTEFNKLAPLFVTPYALDDTELNARIKEIDGDENLSNKLIQIATSA